MSENKDELHIGGTDYQSEDVGEIKRTKFFDPSDNHSGLFWQHQNFRCSKCKTPLLIEPTGEAKFVCECGVSDYESF